MTDDQLVSQIELLERQALGYYGSEVASEQATAMNYYLGRPFGTEEEGRSQVVSSDVWDVVEGLTPLVLKPFVSTDDVVRFSPEGPDDEEAAEQESDYINYVVTQKNDVFETLVAWVKTGLLQKNGVVKYWWEKSKKTSIERYYGLDDDVYTALIQDDDVKVLEHTEYPPEAPEQMQEGMPDDGEQPGPTHDVVLRISEDHGEAKYAAVPPEEFLISRDSTGPDPRKARFIEHRTRKTISEIREMGYDVADDVNDYASDDPQFDVRYQARRAEEATSRLTDESLDPSTRDVIFREVYMLVDFDGDGMAELRKVCLVGRDVLANEETEEIPFCAWTPYQQPFKFYGKCPADETTEIQLIKSTVLRQTMDNIYTITNNRRYVSNKVNIDDLLDNQIGGMIRVDGDIVQNHVMPEQATPIGAITMPMVEYFDSAKENRTGFTRYNQGTDANSLNKTATGVRIIAEAGNERVGLVSRSFAELGLKPLMLGIHGLCRRHGTKAETVRLRGKWVNIDPRQWKTRYDMSVSVGLGTADRQMQMQGAQIILQEQKELVQAGIVKPVNMYNAAAKLAQSVGEKNPERYFTAPDEQPPEPPDPSQDPAFMLEVKKAKQKDTELDQKQQSIDIDKQKADQDGKLIDAQILALKVTGIETHAKLELDIEEKTHARQMAEQQMAQQPGGMNGST